MITDIKITDNFDVACDEAGFPILITDLEVVSQDVKHAILESGLLSLLVAEKSTMMQKIIFNRIIILVEDDKRIIPGTCEIEIINAESFLIKAIADQGSFNIQIKV